MTKTFVFASQVEIGDVLCFGNPKLDVTIERISEAKCDGWIGMHANNETWSSYYKPTDRVRVASTTGLNVSNADGHQLPIRAGALHKMEK